MSEMTFMEEADRWLALRFGKRMEWSGPIIFGVGYLWRGKIWFPENHRRQGDRPDEPKGSALS